MLHGVCEGPRGRKDVTCLIRSELDAILQLHAAVHLVRQLEGLAPRCLNHLEMADAETASQLGRLPDGVDFLTRPSGPVTLVDTAAGTRLQLQHQEPMDLTVVWTEPPRPMVCLEPWTGPRQSLVSGDRKLELSAGQSTTLTCRYLVS